MRSKCCNLPQQLIPQTINATILNRNIGNIWFSLLSFRDMQFMQDRDRTCIQCRTTQHVQLWLPLERQTHFERLCGNQPDDGAKHEILPNISDCFACYLGSVGPSLGPTSRQTYCGSTMFKCTGGSHYPLTILCILHVLLIAYSSFDV